MLMSIKQWSISSILCWYQAVKNVQNMDTSSNMQLYRKQMMRIHPITMMLKKVALANQKY